MSEFKSLLGSRFRGCRMIAEFPDTHRNRIVKVFDIGSDIDVGMNDGVDVWIANASTAVRHPNLLALLQAPKTARRVTLDSIEARPLPIRATTKRVRLNG